MGRRRRHGALTGTTNRRGRDRQTPPGCRAEWFHRGKKRFATPFLSFRKPDPRRSRPGKPRRWRKKRHGWRFPVMGQAKKAPAPTLPAPVAALQLPALAQKAPTRGASWLKLESTSAATDAFWGNGAAGSDCDDTCGDSDGAFCVTGGESWGGLAARTRTPTLESDPDHDPDARCASACASPGAPSASTGACRSIAGIRYPTTAIIRDGQGALGHHGGNLKPRSVRRRVVPWISGACALAGTRFRGGKPDRPAAHRRIHPRCAEAHRPAPCGAAIPDGPRARREQFRCLQS